MKETGGDAIYLQVGEQSSQFYGFERDSSVCIDGILVAGEPGRKGRDLFLGSWSCPFELGDPFVLNITGSIKPALTPARHPPERHFGLDPSWERTRRQAMLCFAMLWEKVTQSLSKGMDHDTYWKLALLHRAPVHWMAADVIWEHVAVPVIGADRKIEWHQLCDLDTVAWKHVKVDGNRHELTIRTAGERRITFGDKFSAWHPQVGGRADDVLRPLITRFSSLGLDAGKLRFSLRLPDPSLDGERREPSLGSRFDRLHVITYEKGLVDTIIALTELGAANRLHPLIQAVMSDDYIEYQAQSALQNYCASVVWCLCDRKNLTQITQNKVHKGRQFRRLGVLYKNLDWDRYGDELKPPYKLFSEESGIVEVTSDELLRWAAFDSDD